MTPRSAEEIRDYLADQLNDVLRRPGLYGNETALRVVFDHYAYVDGREETWRAEQETMRSRGALAPTGVQGAIRNVLGTPDGDDHAVASVYAEFARSQGWLRTDRLLTAEEYASMRDDLAVVCGSDRTFTEVRDRFGAPSVFIGGSNPYFGKTLAYSSGNVADLMIFFHFWNGRGPGGERAMYKEPALLAARCGTGRFGDTFTFTPIGASRTSPKLS
ncbi:hypothetical protein FDA94_07240 [Herbidospora galbida]|uniref:Uncharacterized protein n=1 Tax=Herbidospora galbida TaxID=2575442 RepID=A0A4U3MNC6_9ACTN|nr:hypothetical protein [Herbidospora galbida]TKK90202.1 hypothetical protein FDA94_07240 [Herbidospora galbida]